MRYYSFSSFWIELVSLTRQAQVESKWLNAIGPNGMSYCHKFWSKFKTNLEAFFWAFKSQFSALSRWWWPDLKTKTKQERKHKKAKEKPRPGGDFEGQIFCFAKEAEF